MKRKLFLLTTVVVFSTIAAWFAVYLTGEWRFQQYTKSTAGPGAIDCGQALALTNPASALSCVETAMTSQRPFFAFIEHMGIDSKIVSGIASKADGSIHVIRYGSAPCGRPLSCLPGRLQKQCAVSTYAHSVSRFDHGVWQIKIGCEPN